MMPLARLAAKMSRSEARNARHKGLPGLGRTAQPTQQATALLPARAPDVPRGWGVVGLLALWWWRAKSRQELARLDPEQLRDVGIHPRLARRESEKPFWRH